MFKKLCLCLVFCFSTASIVSAAAYTTWVPNTQNGNSVPDLGFAGVYSYRINASSVAVMVTNPSYLNTAGAINPAPVQSALLYAVAFSTLTASIGATYVVLRDSNTPGIDMSTAVCPEIVYNALIGTTATVKNGLAIQEFNPPLRIRYGLSACVLGGGQNLAPAGSVFIYYRLIDKETR